jgi:hypothetical protein
MWEVVGGMGAYLSPNPIFTIVEYPLGFLNSVGAKLPDYVGAQLPDYPRFICFQV